jgi:uncharacterized membrane protein
LIKTIFRILTALFFIAAGVAHFANPQPFVGIVPPFLPRPLELVWISGVFEIAGGIGLLIPFLRRWAGIGLIALLIAVYPANIYMAINDVPFGDNHLPWWGHLIRLPFQFVLIALAFWIADVRRNTAEPALRTPRS